MFFRYQFRFLFFFIIFTGVLILSGCDPRPEGKPEQLLIETTGYCDCQKCTGWKRNWRFQKVYAYGRNKGKPKKTGITKDGTKVKKGIIAADIRYYPFGTIFYIPQYGYGTVHDTGGKIKGRKRIDLFFHSHEQALKWGRKTIAVKVWNSDIK